MPAVSYIGSTNLVTTATMSANASAPGFGPSNVVDDHGSAESAWQTPVGVVTLAGGALLRADFSPGAQTVRGVAICRTNLTRQATVTFQIWNLSGPTLVYGSGSLAGPQPRYGQVVHVLPSNVVGDSLQILIDDSGNPDGFINVPLVWCGPLWQPGVSVSWESSYGRDTGAARRRARGGQAFIDHWYTARRFDLRLMNVPLSESATLNDLDHDARLGRNCLVVPDSTGDLYREPVLGTITPTADITFPYNTTSQRAWAARVEERL